MASTAAPAHAAPRHLLSALIRIKGSTVLTREKAKIVTGAFRQAGAGALPELTGDTGPGEILG
jgi:hypothetical protein